MKNSFTALNENYNIFNARHSLLLPGVDRVEFALEELEEKHQDVTVKLYQWWKSRPRDEVTSGVTGQTVTERK